MTQTYYKAFAPRIGLAWSPAAAPASCRSCWARRARRAFVRVLACSTIPSSNWCWSSSARNRLSEAAPAWRIRCSIRHSSARTAPSRRIPSTAFSTPRAARPSDWSAYRPILLYGQFQPKMRTQYSEQYNFTIQRELRRRLLFQIGYVGTQAHRLLASYDLNYGNAQTCLDLNAISQPNLANDPSLACGPFDADSAYTIAAGEIPAGFTLHLPYGPQATVTGPERQSHHAGRVAQVFVAELQSADGRGLPARWSAGVLQHLHREHGGQFELQLPAGERGKAFLARSAIPGGLHFQQIDRRCFQLSKTC